MKNIIDAKNLILNSDSIVLSAHTNPDGDAIGSTYALYLALKKIGKEPIVILEDFNPRFNCIMSKDILFNGEIKKPQVFITLDCGDKDRLLEEHFEVWKSADKTINIDHHASNDNFGDINIVDTEKTSASEVVYDLICELCEVDKEIMSAIYAGIVYDSGGFKFSKVSSNTHKIAGIAHDLGIDFNKIYSDMLGAHTLTEISIFARALQNIKFDIENKIIYSHISIKEMEQCNSSKDELGAIVSYLLNTDGFNLAIFVYEKAENINKVSLRSKQLDVNLLASCFGGGGHQLASGCVIEGTIPQALDNVLNKAKELIKDEKFV